MRRRDGHAATAVLAVSLLAALGCSGGTDDRSATDEPAAATEPARAGDAVGGRGAAQGETGTLSGRVTFSGTRPAARQIHMAADPYCAGANEDGVRMQPVVVGPDGGLAEVFVYVRSGLTGPRPTPSSTPVVLDQKGCVYHPRVLGLQVGQPLEIRNSDETLHNVHAVPVRAKGFNVGMPGKGRTATRTFDSAEVFIRIKCDVHPWMAAHVGVVDHPYFAVTGEDGRFALGELPAGEYVVEAMHPSLGAQDESVVVSGGTETEIELGFAR